ncbi:MULTISPECIES: hypothetical protein [unclassified Rathayibacter]|uniref:hypothetical protein n=1 Tax=unclassified Rathayibacter TaxID=2609250 RepID=UPI00104862EA|nr:MULTISPECIES: hypothetical protein [unclassified Rathayibacter]MCJ1687188.1 hypothetical protein [Rathayibacter sp. VKM Ac-2927]MCJ1704321.1 hypothetical protein [Rathayibacter sp. VKM Ac-2926]TCL82971.1 hypothetical protein EDF49_10424 [Rathayibacter sp. PhB192]TCM28468.1 hypothetical protein EDF43_10424 [Rathayibacter sp. PhB179]
MRRLDILYDGAPYTVSDRTAAQFRVEVDAALAAETPQWLAVNHGEGRASTALILITPFTAITILTNDAEDDDTPDAA